MGRIEEIYNKAKFILDNNIIYKDCEVKYILEHPKTKELYLLASDDNDIALEFRLNGDKFNYYNVPEWDYNFDFYLYNYFEDGFDIAYMTYDTHYGLWNSIKDLYPEDIEFKDGVNYYVKYCKGHLINKKTIDENTKLDTPDIMTMFREKKKDEQER